MITEAIKEIMHYAYIHCDKKLKACIDYDEFIKEMGSKLTRKEFSQSILFMMYDGYFSDKANEFSVRDDENTLHFNTLILPRLIREFENPSN